MRVGCGIFASLSASPAPVPCPKLAPNRRPTGPNCPSTDGVDRPTLVTATGAAGVSGSGDPPYLGSYKRPNDATLAHKASIDISLSRLSHQAPRSLAEVEPLISVAAGMVWRQLSSGLCSGTMTSSALRLAVRVSIWNWGRTLEGNVPTCLQAPTFLREFEHIGA